jgi:serine/threonine protein phosphatase 1
VIARLLPSRRRAAAAGAAVPEGVRVYAIGDIHGRQDLLEELITRIDRDDRERGPAETSLIFLGDLVDRGPASAAVIEHLRVLAESRPRVRVLMGNHEEIFLGALDGEPKALRLFCRIGGRETVISYGLSPDQYEQYHYEDLAQWLEREVPPAHKAFMAGFEDMVEIGDYLFVHAGIRPGVALGDQRTSDLRWIREPFLDYRRKLDRMVVHGHTVVPEVEFRPHRIGIDTGAYSSGRLTALGLEGRVTWLIQT